MNHSMVRLLLFTICVMLGLVAPAGAQEPASIGSVTFQVGESRLERNGQSTPLTKGQALQVGDRLVTGANGHVHARMIDNGFISVRPAARLHIQSYTYNPQNPAANRIGLMLESGVARTISGKAGEAARENYRFNTPVAAIGLRGTDYVVQALPDATRVSVLKGAVTLSAFGPNCLINSLAPCTGPLVRELAASLPHAYMEVRAQGGLPVIVPPENGKEAPNKVAPPRPEELNVKVLAPRSEELSVKAAPARPEEIAVTADHQVTSVLAAGALNNSGSAAEAAVEAEAQAKAKAAAEAAAQAATQAKAAAEAQAKAAAEAAAQAAAQAKAAAQAAAQAKAAAEAAAALALTEAQAKANSAAEAAAAQAMAEAQAAAEAAAAQAVADAQAKAKAAADAAAKAQAEALAAAKAQAAADAAARAQAEALAAAQAQAAADAAAKAQAEALAAAQAQAAADAAAKAQADALALAQAQAQARAAAPPELVWGRWASAALPNTPTVTSLLSANREITFSNALFGLLRPAGTPELPASGVIGMYYMQGEAYVQTTQSGAPALLTPAALSNGKLQLDFNNRQFSTSLSAAAEGKTYDLQAEGKIHFQGLLLVDASRSNMNLAGALSNNATEAGYLFDAGVAANQTLIGATRWRR